MNTRRILFDILMAAVAVAAMADGAAAFCPMCQTAIEGAAGAREVAGSLNLAALVLLVPPVMIFATLFGMFYRLRHANGRDASLKGVGDDADERRRALTD